MNPDKWEAVSNAAESGVMVSNLPLLFADGRPTSLDTIKLEQLQRFFPFMVKCSIGEDQTVPWSQLPKPPWWPTRLPFRVPQHASSSSTRSILVRLVTRCYDYHSCPYLLQFCATLVGLQQSTGYRFHDNKDGTTSMYHGVTGKQLVTFRNENRDYDKCIKEPKTPKSQKKLLPLLNKNASPRKDGTVPPPALDVYLCDQCDDEFSTLKDVQEHEKHCEGNEPPTPPIPSPESPSTDEDAPNPADNTYLLQVLGLRPTDASSSHPRSPRRGIRSPTKQVYRNYYRYVNMDISSPFGQQIIKKLRKSPKEPSPDQQLKYEKYIDAGPRSNYGPNTLRPKRWLTNYKANKTKSNTWTHEKCFTKEQKQEKRITLETGLDSASRTLFLQHCKPVDVQVKKMSHETIEKRTISVNLKTAVVDLTEELSVAKCSPPPVKLPVKLLQNGTSSVLEHAENPLALQPFLGDVNTHVKSMNKETEFLLKKIAPSVQVKPVIKCPEVIDIISSSDEEESGISSSHRHNQKNGLSHWLPPASETNRCFGQDVVVNGTLGCSSVVSTSTEEFSTKVHSVLLDQFTDSSNYRALHKIWQQKSLTPDTALFLRKFIKCIQQKQKLDKSFHKKTKKSRNRGLRELHQLRVDECRELRNRGLCNLYAINGVEEGVKTRCLASNLQKQVVELFQRVSFENIDTKGKYFIDGSISSHPEKNTSAQCSSYPRRIKSCKERKSSNSRIINRKSRSSNMVRVRSSVRRKSREMEGLRSLESFVNLR